MRSFLKTGAKILFIYDLAIKKLLKKSPVKPGMTYMAIKRFPVRALPVQLS